MVALPSVLIIGGSNSIKFTPEVASYLAEVAAVERVPDNARSTRYTREHIEEWLGSGHWQVIHLNWGMHDLTRIDGENPQVDIEEYAKNLRILFRRLSSAGDQLIWATTMFMFEERQPKRRLGDIHAYNLAANTVAAEHELETHDLHSFTADRPELYGPDGLHFTDEGYRVLGAEVGRAIREALRASPQTPGSGVGRRLTNPG